MKRYEQTEIGPLEVLKVEGDPDKPCVILFHGYGADASDLLSLSQIVKSHQDLTWIFPNGSESVPVGPGSYGRGWFPVDMDALEKAMRSGSHRDMSENEPPGLGRARELAVEMLKELSWDFSKIIIGGFSQGAMLSTDLALRADVNPAGLCILSGTILNEKTWSELAPKREGLKFFQSHGRQDALLGFSHAQRLEKLLLKAGLRGQLQPFNGGHEIPLEVLESLSRYITRAVDTICNK